MAGTHEENVKDPAWLTEQLKQAKAQRDALQEKHDAQLAGIAEDKKTIATLNDLVDDFKKRFADVESALVQEKHRLQETAGTLRASNSALAEALRGQNDALALAKSRRTALAEVMKIISPVLAGE